MSQITEVTDSSFKTEVLESEKPVVVDFWAPWCGPCRMVAPVVEAVAEKLNDRVKFVKVNTDENFKTAQDHRILGIPSLLLFRDGNEADRIVGFTPQDKLEARMKKVFELE